jgi:hypothetical protein
MNTYKIERRLHIFSRLWGVDEKEIASFAMNNISFSHWEWNYANGATTHYWLIEQEVNATDYRKAFEIHYKESEEIVSKLAFITQSYCEDKREPFLIHKKNSDIVYFRYTRDSSGVPLYFNKNSLNVLIKLLENTHVPKQFYYYWNDMINSTNYSSKLLLLCSALEALAKGLYPNKKKHDALREILGEDLHLKLWERDHKGIRHRLTHGEYFNDETDNENYVQQAYEKILDFFNSTILEDKLLNTDVKNPQRHFSGNKEGGHYFLQNRNGKKEFTLKELLDIADKGLDQLTDQYDFISERDITPEY